jgi:hypothetical protein
MSEQDERLRLELELLQSMYPDQVSYSERAREVSYKSSNGSIAVRLPSGYLNDDLPTVLSANAGRADLRASLKGKINELAAGEEVLDSVILAFEDIAASSSDQALKDITTTVDQNTQAKNPSLVGDAQVTVIVWLHHLLNTNKRKQALSPPSPSVHGITKPGYPGVLIYAGPNDAVHEHVNELKSLNWQAFQVRHEEDEAWSFAHGSGVKELEAMKDVVAEIGENRKEAFMEAMRMK